MKQALRIGIALAAVALVGCGGRPLAPGKEAAAGALFQSSRGASGTPGMLAQVMNSGVGNFTEVKVSCPHGGQVAIQFTVNVTDPQASITYDLVYDGCSFDGHTSMKGTLHMTYDITTSGPSVDLAMNLNGHIEFWGDISDHIDANITETVHQGDLNSPATSVSITLDGTISNSSGTYTFDNEVLVINGSGFQAAPEEG
jgi:hypothetical protein